MKIEITSRDFISILLIIVGLVFILGFNTSIRSHITFGDEGFHAGMSRWIAENKEYPQWDPLGYTNVFKTNFARPPLFNILGASFLFILGEHEIILKILPLLISALIGIASYLLVRRLYNKETGLISSLILIGLPSFVTHTVLTVDETLFTFNMMFFILTFMLAIKENSKKYWILSAIFAGLSILTKNAGMIIFVFIGLAFLYRIYKERKFIHELKQVVSFFIIVTLISGPFFLRTFAFYNTPTCFPVPLISLDISGCEIRYFEEKREFEIRTLAGGTENNILTFGLLNYVNFAYGNYWFILIGFVGGLLVLLKKRDEITPYLLIMLSLGLIVFFQTVQRTEDAARQLLLWSVLIAIVSAKYWNEIYVFLGKNMKYLGLIIVILILFLSYQNVTSKLKAMEGVKQFSPLFFEACDWVKENLNEDVRLMTFWGYRASYSCERIISSGWPDIRLNDNTEDTVNIAKMHGITHFFIQKFSITQQPSRESYSIGFVQLLENNQDKFKKVFENGPDLNQCQQQGGCDGNIIYKVIY